MEKQREQTPSLELTLQRHPSKAPQSLLFQDPGHSSIMRIPAGFQRWFHTKGRKNPLESPELWLCYCNHPGNAALHGILGFVPPPAACWSWHNQRQPFPNSPHGWHRLSHSSDIYSHKDFETSSTFGMIPPENIPVPARSEGFLFSRALQHVRNVLGSTLAG